MNEDLSQINIAEKALEEGNLDLLRDILPPLLEKNIAAAIRINASFFDADVPEGECDRLYVEGMFKAAELGDLKAQYQVGAFYELGEYGVPQNKQKASEIFKELAEKGNAHCMWIYSCELIWGKGSFPKDTEQGLKLLHKSAGLGSAEACITIAGFHDKGDFDHEINIHKRDSYRQRAIQYDDTTYDPYA